MPSQDATDFLSRVRRKAQWPDDAKLTSAQILQIADEEIASFIYPLIRGVGEAYNVKRAVIPLVAGTALYRIPQRATSGTIFDVSLQDQNGNLRRLSKVQTADIYMFAIGVNQSATGTPTGYAIEGDQIRLLPTPGVNFSIMVRYERRPSALVEVADCWRIISVAGNTVNISTEPVEILPEYDIVQSLPNFDAIVDSAVLTSSGGVAPFFFTFSGTDITGTVIGDYLATPGETCVVPVPDALYPVLIDKVAAEMLDEAGDAAGAARVLAHMERVLEGAMETIGPRAETSAPAVFNRWSPMRIS